MANVNIQEGEAVFDVPSAGKPCKTHYWIVGDLKSGKTPVVILHGGPGATHHYVSIHDELYNLHGIPVILYDQIGNGDSTHLPEKMGDTDFWTVQLFIDELNNLLKHLGIDDAYDILGHSWGGMLATYFLENRVSRGLRHLVLVGSPSSAKLLDECTSELIKGFPEKLRASVEKKQRGEEYDEADLEEAGKVYFTRHVCQLESMPAEITETMMTKNADPTVNEAL